MIPTIAPTGSGLDSLEDDERAAPAVAADVPDSVMIDEADKTGSLSVTSGSAVGLRGGSLISSVVEGCLVVVLVLINARLGEEVVVVKGSVTSSVSVNLKVGTSFDDEGDGEDDGRG
jgi:hypothetical protein